MLLTALEFAANLGQIVRPSSTRRCQPGMHASRAFHRAKRFESPFSGVSPSKKNETLGLSSSYCLEQPSHSGTQLFSAWQKEGIRSTFLPRILGVLLASSGLYYLINCFSNFGASVALHSDPRRRETIVGPVVCRNRCERSTNGSCTPAQPEKSDCRALSSSYFRIMGPLEFISPARRLARHLAAVWAISPVRGHRR